MAEGLLTVRQYQVLHDETTTGGQEWLVVDLASGQVVGRFRAGRAEKRARVFAAQLNESRTD